MFSLQMRAYDLVFISFEERSRTQNTVFYAWPFTEHKQQTSERILRFKNIAWRQTECWRLASSFWSKEKNQCFFHLLYFLNKLPKSVFAEKTSTAFAEVR